VLEKQIVGESGPGVVKVIGKQGRSHACESSGHYISPSEPFVAVFAFVVCKESLKNVAEGKGDGLSGKVANNVGKIASP